MLDAHLRCGCCQPRRCQPVDAIVCGGVGALGVGNAGEMNDLIDAVQQRLPVECLRQIRMLHHFDAIGERQMRPPNCRAHRVTIARQSLDYGAADEAGCAGDQDAAHAAAPLERCEQPGNENSAKSQRCDFARPARHDHGNDRQNAEADIHGEYASDHGHGRKTLVGGALIEMRPVRLPERFAPDEAPEQGDGGIGEVIEGHHHSGDQMTAAGDQ